MAVEAGKYVQGQFNYVANTPFKKQLSDGLESLKNPETYEGPAELATALFLTKNFSPTSQFVQRTSYLARSSIVPNLADDAARTSTNLVEQTVVHGNSLKSLKPTWGYKLYSNDGAFLKNGITSKLAPESRYTKSFMSDKFMEKFPFPNRKAAWDWEFQENQILRGPLNKNMH